MYYDAHTGKLTAFDGREKAPAGAHADMFLDEHGKPMSYVEAVRSGRSTGVPGVMAMLWSAQHRFGALHWKDLFEPAIRSASQGFRVPARLAMFLSEGSPFPPTNEVRNLFSRPDGDVIEEGDLFQNPQYAHTLEAIASEGPRALYEGEIADAIVHATHQGPLPGTMTPNDLASYHADASPPLCRGYRGYTVCVPPPPSRCSPFSIRPISPRGARRIRRPGSCSRRQAASFMPIATATLRIRTSCRCLSIACWIRHTFACGSS
jgi:gamma-glutamyltranspeptidase/glutathione hydrolase